VQYAGDSNYNPGTSQALNFTVQPDAPTVTVTPSAQFVTNTQSFKVSVHVNGPAGIPPPTGSVVLVIESMISSNTYPVAPATLVNGNATFTVTPSSVFAGYNYLDVSYTPDVPSSSLYTTSQGEAVVVQTGTIVPVVAVTPSATSITDQQNVTVVVTVLGINSINAIPPLRESNALDRIV
jgi:hypothetical protein